MEKGLFREVKGFVVLLTAFAVLHLQAPVWHEDQALKILDLSSAFGQEAQKILLIGDSHTAGPFGWKLDEYLRTLYKNHAAVASYGNCGTTPLSWLKGSMGTCTGYFEHKETGDSKMEGNLKQTPRLETLLQKHDPDIVIVALGANCRGIKDEKTGKMTKEIISMISDPKRRTSRKCIWIGPPRTRKDGANGIGEKTELGRLYKVLQETAKECGCKFVDSRLKEIVYPAKGGDGVHYWFKRPGAGNPSLAEIWANGVFEEIKTHLNPQH